MGLTHQRCRIEQSAIQGEAFVPAPVLSLEQP